VTAFRLLVLLFPLAALAQDGNRGEFAALDLNSDGRVSLAEAAGFPNVVMRFDKADRNRDGRLTMAEFNRLKKLKIPVSKPRDTKQARAGRSAAAGASARR
jgi:hypothetical protein